MKNFRKTQLFILSLSLLTIVACKKPVEPEPKDKELPALTHKGLNTFGCRINGEVWVAEAPFSLGGPAKLEGAYNEATGGFWLEATRKTKGITKYEYIKFYGLALNTVGNYKMSVLTKKITGFNDLLNSEYYPCKGYKHDTLNIGNIRGNGQIGCSNPLYSMISLALPQIKGYE